jgi:glyoxylase-like metal-dependent hydrolase (beta-lactamase superfamily II)
MRIGKYEIHPIETGRFALDGGAMFGVVPKIMWEKTNPPDERNRIDLAARCLLIRGNGRTILVDNGNGNKFTPKLVDIYRLDNSRYELFDSLRRHGVAPGDVTDVVLTHLHFDHAGGSTIRVDGELKAAFPNARYCVQKAHWEQAMKPTEKDRASFMPDDYLPLMERGLLDLIDGERDLFDGISVVLVNGHTAAQQLPKISDGTTTLLFCCDLFPTIHHVPLPYIMAYDLRPLTTLEDKRRILEQAANEKWTLFFEHDPSVAAGTVRRTEKGFVFGSEVNLD